MFSWNFFSDVSHRLYTLPLVYFLLSKVCSSNHLHCLLCISIALNSPGAIIYFVALRMMSTNNTKNKPTRTSSGLSRSFSATLNTVAFEWYVPWNILRDNTDLTYVYPEGNYSCKISDIFIN